MHEFTALEKFTQQDSKVQYQQYPKKNYLNSKNTKNDNRFINKWSKREFFTFAMEYVTTGTT